MASVIRISKTGKVTYTRYYYVDDNVPNFLIYKKATFIRNLIATIFIFIKNVKDGKNIYNKGELK